MDIEQFKKKRKPKQTSSLHQNRDDILNLIQSGYSQTSICEFLNSNGIKTTQPNLCKFIKKMSKTTTQKVEKISQIQPQNTTKVDDVQVEKIEKKESGLLKQSTVKSFEIKEPDYSKFNR